MIKVSKSRLLTFVVLLIIGVILLCVNDPVLLLAYMTIIFVMIVLEGKYTFFSVLAFIMLFSYIQAVIYKLAGVTSGMLKYTGTGKTIPFYFNEMSISFVSFFLCELGFAWFTRMIEYEKSLYSIKIEMTRTSAYILLALSIFLVFAVFPSFPTFRIDLETRRTQGISSVYGFLTLALCLAALTIDASRTYKVLILGYVLIVFWIMGHGERVEVFGFIIYLTLKMLNKYDLQKTHGISTSIKKIAVFGIIGIVALLGTWIGLVRILGMKVSLSEVIYKLFIQGTCSDVLYVFDCAIDMWKNGNLLHGYTYLDYLLQLIPGAPNTYQSAVVMHSYYFTMGGCLFFAESMMNFGLIGTVIFNIEFFAVMNVLIRKATQLRAYIWVPITIEIFRTAWYGRSGWILAGFIEMPILYFVLYHVSGRSDLRNRRC